MATREVIEPVILAALPTARQVTLDLGELTFCDSYGVAMFLAAKEKAEAEGRTLVLGNLQPIVARVFQISGIDQVLTVTE